MKPPPRFELRRIDADEHSGPPLIVPLAALPWDITTDRAGFLKTGIVASAAVALSGCFGKKSAAPCLESGMTDLITDVALTPDGDTLVIAGSLGVQLRRTTDAKMIRELEGYGAVAVSPDGRFLATGEPGGLSLWRLPSGEYAGGHNHPVGEYIVLGSSPDLIAWDSNDSIEVRRTKDLLQPADSSEAQPKQRDIPPVMTLKRGGDVIALALVPHARLLLTAEHDAVHLWRVPQGSRIASVSIGREDGLPIYDLAVSPDGRLFGVASRFGIHVWQVADRKLVARRAGYADSLAISGNHYLAFVAGGRGTVWNLVSSRPGPALTDKDDPQGGPVAISQDATRAVFGGLRAEIWDVPRRERLHEIACKQPSGDSGGGGSQGGGGCSCNTVCTCIPVSDRALKTEVQPMSSPEPLAPANDAGVEAATPPDLLARIAQLHGVVWQWKEDPAVRSLGLEPGRRAAGVIAQDVQAAFPDLVAQDAHGYLHVDYNGLVGVLVEAVTTLDSRIRDLERALSARPEPALEEHRQE